MRVYYLRVKPLTSLLINSLNKDSPPPLSAFKERKKPASWSWSCWLDEEHSSPTSLIRKSLKDLSAMQDSRAKPVSCTSLTWSADASTPLRLNNLWRHYTARCGEGLRSVKWSESRAAPQGQLSKTGNNQWRCSEGLDRYLNVNYPSPFSQEKWTRGDIQDHRVHSDLQTIPVPQSNFVDFFFV